MDPVIEIIECSNQRGGRMLSVIDLLEAGTLNRRQLCRLIERIELGSSWLVGAKPGGAGKTAVMSALLGMLPAGESVRLANPGTGWEKSRPGECVVAYEISRGRYDAYIWGADVQCLARLGKAGCRIVTNLHADTIEEARHQVVNENGVPEDNFAAFDMFLPVMVRRSFMSVWRLVERIHICRDDEWREFDESESLSEREKEIESFLDLCCDKGQRTVREVRNSWREWCWLGCDKRKGARQPRDQAP